MNHVARKLADCFALTFPNLSAERIPTASAENLSEWDSIAHITLLTVIGEQFGIDVDFEEFEGALSFEALAAKLQERSAGV
jgi:acyl carrier protein